jgi:hypothetical protein
MLLINKASPARKLRENYFVCPNTPDIYIYIYRALEQRKTKKNIISKIFNTIISPTYAEIPVTLCYE